MKKMETDIEEITRKLEFATTTNAAKSVVSSCINAGASAVQTMVKNAGKALDSIKQNTEHTNMHSREQTETSCVRYESCGRSGANFYYNETFIKQDSVKVRYFRPSTENFGDII